MRKSILVGLFAAVAAMLTISCARTQKLEARSLDAPDIPTVAVARAKTADLSHQIVLTAEFRPFQEIDVMAKVAGYVKVINVDIGDRVKLGQALATLEIPEMADDRSRASASVERSQAEVARARDELRRSESAHELISIALVMDHFKTGHKGSIQTSHFER